MILAVAEHTATAEAAHGLTPDAMVLPFKLFGVLPVTNSMVITWGVAIILIVFSQLATRNAQRIPSGLQNFWEWIVESLFTFLEGIIGYQILKKSFWFFATIFIFILATNWFSLIPGVGTIGWGHEVAGGFHVAIPLIRGGNADLNMTLAMSLVFFALWIILAIQFNGVFGFAKHIFGSKGGLKGFMGLVVAAIFLVVGLIEVVSILFRPVSLSFRLYGNIFAGENLLEAMSHLVHSPFLNWILPLPFYFLELLVGFVQALVFCLLTSIFTLLICTHDEEHAENH
ncbi:MAG: F0F1 ATP synthase subunit A [Verrucomicrobiota bacterium]|nr:F0F1 ATP synthase subunit A [Verrucomicrobiota bacterium]